MGNEKVWITYAGVVGEGGVSNGLVKWLKAVEATRAAKVPHKIRKGSRGLTNIIAWESLNQGYHNGVNMIPENPIAELWAWDAMFNILQYMYLSYPMLQSHLD